MSIDRKKEGKKNMEILSKKINKINYTFNCKTFDNRYTWGHKVQMIVDNIIVLENKIVYYNRTWENFNYQSCINGAINLYYNDLFNNYLLEYKQKNNVTRLKKEIKEQLQKDFNKLDNIKSLLKLKKFVNNARSSYDFKYQYINNEF